MVRWAICLFACAPRTARSLPFGGLRTDRRYFEAVEYNIIPYDGSVCALLGANTCGGQLHADRAVGERGVFLLPTMETRLLVVET